MLDAARVALAAGQTDQAAKAYAALIKRRSQLPTIISDLRAAVELDPRAAGLWQVLGDAFMKNDQVNDAIEAYRRGMEVA
jgi:cytochrome c-type biogenesis protein CcmH/NrfG